MTSPLTSYRKSMGISLQAMAGRLNVNKSTVLRWEKGKVPAERVPELERVTGIPRKQLRGDLYGAA
jgi:transcriptional regulator with XRE-family HTH domain